MEPVLRWQRRRRRGPLLSLGRAPAWADAVFHVLAHVEVHAAASCFSPAYREWAAERLGPTGGRALDEDARVLGELARAEPVAFASAQAIAWVFRSAESVRAATDHELRDALVDDEGARAIAVAAGPIAEVLRAAAELELSLLGERMPSAAFPWPGDETEAALARVATAAPELAACRVELTPALGLRGRVYHAHVFAGVPGIAGATAEHVAWQAAHEATVHEVSSREPALPFSELERRAVGRLRSRARRVGLGDAHARWLAHLDLSELGPIPDVEDPA